MEESRMATKTARAKRSDRHFRTDHLMDDLAGRSARGGVITVTAQAAKFALQTGSTMVLARLLTPADFGLFAMVAVFTRFIERFRDLGLSAATVQRPEVGHDQVSTLFWINVAASIVLMLITVAISPLVSWFYGEDALAWITIALSVTFLFGGLSAQHTALLRRQMRFTALAIVDVGSIMVGIMCAIGVAMAGGGYWALVSLAAGQALATAILSIAVSGWRPGWWRLDRDVAEMLRFGGSLAGFNIVNYITRNADNLLIGRYLGAAELGIYSRAYALLLLPVQQINGPIAAVAIPALSRLQSHKAEYRRYYLKIVQVIAYVSMPSVILLGVLADEVVLLLLGSQWQGAAPIFQIFAVFVLVQNVVVTTGWVLQSMGRAWRQLKWGAVQAPVLVLACIIGIQWGAVGVAIAVTAQALMMTLPAMFVAYYNSPVSIKDVGIAISRPSIIAGVLFVLTWSSYAFLEDREITIRVAGVLSVAVIFGVLVLLISRTVRNDLTSIAAVMKR
jgi:O-antigen/teichoic acid export membrane protein